jgi:hypothetical protein
MITKERRKISGDENGKVPSDILSGMDKIRAVVTCVCCDGQPYAFLIINV